MSNASDDPKVLSVLLLRQAGLRDFEDILLDQPAALARRLEAANRAQNPAAEPLGEDAVNDLISLARRHCHGEITEIALRSPELFEPPAPDWTEPVGGTPIIDRPPFGLTGDDDFEPLRRRDDDRSLPGDADSSLPGIDDFEPKRRPGDEDL